jgi:hypothetical protein
MIRNRRKFSAGITLLAGFAVILGVLFSPVFGGHNGLNFLDSLYNAISKGSAYYLPDVTEKAGAVSDTDITVSLQLAEGVMAQAEILFEKSGADAVPFDGRLTVSGNLGKIFGSCLTDAENMYNNDGSAVRAKYGMEEKQALYTWHTAFKAMEKDLNRQKKFKEAKVVGIVVDKAVDLSYNYYGIEAGKISDSPGVVVLSLVFYVVYTLWFGFAILFLFEGVGMQLEH